MWPDQPLEFDISSHDPTGVLISEPDMILVTAVPWLLIKRRMYTGLVLIIHFSVFISFEGAVSP